LPKDTVNQHWMPRSVLEMEREAIERLNSREGMNESLAAELDARDRAYLEISESRNRTESEIDRREEQDRKRLVAEMEEEAAAKLRGHKS
jgi:hypothetical protein